MWFFLFGILAAILAGGVIIGLLCLVGYVVLWLLSLIAMIFGK